MKKALLTFLTLTTIICCTMFGLTVAHASESDTIYKEDLNLLLPNSYEQYLNLSNPTDITVADNTFAIADNDKIFYYDGSVYQTYTHTKKINKVEFGKRGEYSCIFFLDISSDLFALRIDSFDTPDNIGSCQDFTYVNGKIYFTTISSKTLTIHYIESTQETSNKITLTPSSGWDSCEMSSISNVNENVFYSVNNKIYLAGEESEILSTTGNISELVAYSYNGSEYLCYTKSTDDTKNLHRYNKTENCKASLVKGNFTSVKHFNSYLYLIEGKSVKKYSITDEQMTDYEICSASSSINRLDNAKHIDFYKDCIYTADYNNKRISIYNSKTQTYSVIPCVLQSVEFAPTYVCAGEKDMYVLSLQGETTHFYLYTFSTGKWKEVAPSTENKVVGVTYVFGNYYVVDRNSYFYKYDTKTNEQTSKSKSLTGLTPELISSDIDGNVYIAFKGNSGGTICYQVKKYTEDEFLSDVQPTSTECSFNVDTLLAFDIDYQNNYYALTNDNKLLVNEDKEYTISFDNLIFESGILAKSFSINFETETLYLLTDNMITTTNKLNIQNTNNIAVDNVDEQIFSPTSIGVDEVSIVTIDEKSTCVQFNLNELKDATVFPYTQYYRQDTQTNAVKLGEIDKYNIVAIYNSKTREYSTCLVKKVDCNDVELSEYLISSSTNTTKFTSNAVYLYKYPYLTASLSIERLSKNTTISVLGEINLKDELDYNYSYVQYTHNGEVFTGYIPTNFLITIQALKSDDYSASILFLQKKSIKMFADDGTELIVKKGKQLIVYNEEREDGTLLALYTNEEGKIFYAFINRKDVTPSGMETVTNLILAMIVLAGVLIVICYIVILKGIITYKKIELPIKREPTI